MHGLHQGQNIPWEQRVVSAFLYLPIAGREWLRCRVVRGPVVCLRAAGVAGSGTGTGRARQLLNRRMLSL
jgi:hypothetical protein